MYFSLLRLRNFIQTDFTRSVRVSIKYVAFLDVLGFKNMVEKSPHEKLERVYQNAFILNATSSLANGKVIPVKTDQGEYVTPDLSDPLTSCLIVSDSVILWTENVSMRSFVNIFSAVGKILVSGFYTGLPMRGGIAIGDLSNLSLNPAAHDKVLIQSVFGKALTKAYTIESDQQWAGCAISEECIDQYNREASRLIGTVENLATIEHIISQRILLRYPVPKKNGTREDMWVVNWPRFNRDLPTNQTVVDAFAMHNKDASHPAVQTKLKNTLAFLNYVTAL